MSTGALAAFTQSQIAKKEKGELPQEEPKVPARAAGAEASAVKPPLEEEARKKQEEEEARKKEEEARKKLEEEEARLEEEEARLNEEEKRLMEEEARKKNAEMSADDLAEWITGSKEKKQNRPPQTKKKDEKIKAKEKHLRQQEKAWQQKKEEEEREEKARRLEREKEKADQAKEAKKVRGDLEKALSDMIKKLEVARDKHPANDNKYKDIRAKANTAVTELQDVQNKIKTIDLKKGGEVMLKATSTLEEVKAFVYVPPPTPAQRRQKIVDDLAVNLSIRVSQDAWQGAKGGELVADVDPNDMDLWQEVYGRFHNKEVPGHENKPYPGKVDGKTKVCYYVTQTSKSGYAYDVSGHIWQDGKDTKNTVFVLHIKKRL